jgi:hypothetical protein
MVSSVGQRERRCALLAGLVLLAGCSGIAGPGWPKPSPEAAATASAWTRPGADSAAVESAYDDCLALTETATRTDSDIDQDISASRASDLQHSEFAQTQVQQNRETTRDRAQAVLSSCMEGKGFAPSAK